MKTKTIRQVLAQKHKELCESITDLHVRELVRRNSIITGGSIVSMLLGEKVNDYDVYFTDMQTTKAVAGYYVALFAKTNCQSDIKVLTSETGRISIFIPSRGVAGESPDLDEEPTQADETVGPEQTDYSPVFMSENAIMLSGKIQLIVRFYGSPEEVHKNFDFVHCTSYWTSSDGKLVLPASALEKILTKELSYIGSLYPVCSIIRTRKFVQRGWTINAGSFLKMCWQVSKLDLSNVSVLKDQLTGVDSAYFRMAIDVLEKEQESKPGFKLAEPYLFEIIDRVFGK